jgi:hypothetical protein
MRLPFLPATVSLIGGLALGGCASMDEGGSSYADQATASAETSTSTESGSATASAENSASRDDRASTTAMRETRSGSASADSGDLVSQLDAASRELAKLRAANAKLRAQAQSGGSSSASASASSPRSTPADEKLSQLRSYTQFKQELATIVGDVDKLRAENAALAAQAKEATAALAKVEKQLDAEHDARLEAERTAASLRDQLRAVARAVKAADVSLDERSARSGR